ncbi:MAG TPA: YihY/virulence factor BrkB family protein [Bryobacteraceae bacterium]|jgi:membrane protein|nr:YihY/virulence factor BrkB family protein [Bryobacteraceae bacterium]
MPSLNVSTFPSKYDQFVMTLRDSFGFFTLPKREIGRLFRATYFEWSAKDAARLGAALAYYTMFSLAPLLVVVIAIAGVFFGPDATRGQVVWQMQELVGREGGEAVQALLKSTQEPTRGLGPALLGLITLVFGASLVVAELRNALNTIWEVPPLKEAGGVVTQIWDLMKRRLFAFMLVVGIGFLLLISLVVNAVLAALGTYFNGELPLPEWALQLVNFMVSFAISTFVFAAIYKVLPDLRIAWSDVLVGAAVTSILFNVGKLAISLYLGKSSLGSAYGAAGSFAVLLAWVYYSAQIFFFGAVFTHVHSKTVNKLARRGYAGPRGNRKVSTTPNLPHTPFPST